MAIKFILLDKERKLFPIFGDILDITGHKLMVALDETKAMDLLNTVRPDFIILNYRDINFFWDVIQNGIFSLPLFLLEDYEHVDKIKELGFSDFNIITIPFNPLEFLNKSAKLYNMYKEIEDKISGSFGITNILISLLAKRVSVGALLTSGDRTCEVEDVNVSLIPYEADVKLNTYFKNNQEFFAVFVSPTPESVQEVVQEEVAPSIEALFSVADDFFLIGLVDKDGLLQRNVYLRIYRKGDGSIPLLFNLAPNQNFPTIKESIEKVLGGLEQLKALVLMDNLPENTQSILNMLSLSPKLYVITSFPIALSLIFLGVPEKRIKLIESFPDGLLNLETGNALRFIKTPFLPDKGSFVVMEEGRKILFSSKLFSSYCLPEDYSPTKSANMNMIMLYHTVNFLGYENPTALSLIRLSNPTAIYPAFGNPILENIDELLDTISKYKATFNQANLEDEPLVLGLVSGILFELEKEMPREKYESLLDSLSEYADVEGGVVSKVFVDIRRFPELFLYVLHSIKPPPRILLSALYRFVKAEIPVFTI
ncbi:hypothetical protein [Thermocrinis sp.]|uniref:hypothetical protein n=1 Tax=Thermocrinis sp. TaxID=2024383 RepID=UPI002FDD4DDC